MDADALAERILKDLDNIFSKDPFIAEVDVVPLEECVQNKCPVIHVAHQVAIESWCIKHVYQYAYRKLMEWRGRPHKIDASILLGWTRAVLIINPDIQVAWNVRRELVCSQKHDVKDELQFSSIVLTRKPKCSEIFTHRRWLLERLIQSSGWDGLAANLFELEANVCQKAASAYPHNYYAWSHRIWAVQRASIPLPKVVLDELERTEDWVQSHVSDYSGFQFRQFLYSWWIKNCDSATLSNHCQMLSHNNILGLDECSSPDQKPSHALPSLLHEMDTNSKLITFYQGHEALWYHRRFILHTLGSFVSSGKIKVPNINAEADLLQTAKRIKLDDCLQFFGLGCEVKFMKDCIDQSQNNTRQLQLVERHKEWIQHVLVQSLPTNC